MSICVLPYCIRVCLFISDGWEINSDQPARRDEITTVEQTHGQAVFRAAGGDEARARRHVSCGRVGCLCSPLCSLLSPVPLLLLLLLFCWPCRGAGCHQRRQATKGREGEARGSLAEVKVNLPPAEAMKAREERIRQARRKGKLPLIVIVVKEHLSCFSRRPSALLICKVNWQA